MFTFTCLLLLRQRLLLRRDWAYIIAPDESRFEIFAKMAKTKKRVSICFGAEKYNRPDLLIIALSSFQRSERNNRVLNIMKEILNH